MRGDHQFPKPQDPYTFGNIVATCQHKNYRMEEDSNSKASIKESVDSEGSTDVGRSNSEEDSSSDDERVHSRRAKQRKKRRGRVGAFLKIFHDLNIPGIH